MKSVAIILSLCLFNFAQAELTAEESKVNSKLINMIRNCSNVNLPELANDYRSININAAGTKLVFMEIPNNPFMDTSGPKVKKVVKLSKNGACSVRDANMLDSKMGKSRLSYADFWLVQCQKQIVEVSSKGLSVGDISQVITKRKGNTETEILKYDLLDEAGEVVAQLSSIYETIKEDIIIEDYFPEPVGVGCTLK